MQPISFSPLPLHSFISTQYRAGAAATLNKELFGGEKLILQSYILQVSTVPVQTSPWTMEKW